MYASKRTAKGKVGSSRSQKQDSRKRPNKARSDSRRNSGVSEAGKSRIIKPPQGEKGTTMPIDKTALTVALQEVADQFQVHIIGTATPVSPEDVKFDVQAVATPAV